MPNTGSFFPTIYGRNLVAELPNFVHRPYLVVTMADLWPKLQPFFQADLGPSLHIDSTTGTHIHLVETLELPQLRKIVSSLPPCNSVIGIGGGQAIDVAKFIAWSRRLPLFQVPTATSVDAVFGHRAAVRIEGKVRYLGWAVPEAVYVDFDLIQGAPPLLNRSGVSDILCYHTALFDWQLAHTRGKTASQWPYDQGLVDEARQVLNQVMNRLDEIGAVTETGIRTLMNALRWGGAAYHNAGWNPCHIEGSEHFFFYTLEYLTGKKFIHGQAVGLGIYICSALQENQPEQILTALQRIGIDIRPEAMGVTWDEVAATMYKMGSYAQETGLWYTVISERLVTAKLFDHIRKRINAVYQ